MDLVIVAGTRPEVVKLAPLIKALKKSDIRFEFVLSGQHPDLAEDVLPSLDLGYDERITGIRNGSLGVREASLSQAIDYHLRESSARNVLALGDTSTALVACRIAYTQKRKFFHVEAGLRTHNKMSPHPEEQNRTTIGGSANIHFAPSERAAQNLKDEGVNPNTIYVVGSTFLEAFSEVRKVGKKAEFFLSDNTHGQWDFVVDGKIRAKDAKTPTIPAKTVLFTAHRRESIPGGIKAICDVALDFTKNNAPFDATGTPNFAIWPVHPNPEVNEVVRPRLGYKHRVKLTRPLQYHEMSWLMEHVDVIVTDSAGVMEEASVLGVPTVVARNETERPELIEAYPNLLLARPNRTELTEQLVKALSLPKRPIEPIDHIYGGHPTSERIVSILQKEILR